MEIIIPAIDNIEGKCLYDLLTLAEGEQIRDLIPKLKKPAVPELLNSI